MSDRREPIRSSDPESLVKLQEWLEELDRKHRKMIKANRIVRAGGDVDELVKVGLTWAQAMAAYEAGGFDWPTLNRSNSQRQQIKARMRNIRQARQAGPKQYDVIEGVRYFEDPGKMRLGFLFSQAAIPKEISTYMIGRGFWWSMQRGAFERHLTRSSKSAAANARLFLRRWQNG